MGLSLTLNIAAQTLMNTQLEIQTASNNISNASTHGVCGRDRGSDGKSDDSDHLRAGWVPEQPSARLLRRGTAFSNSNS